MFVGQEAYFLEKTTSTNTWLWQYVKARQPAEGVLVQTDYQTAGKGRSQNQWLSEAGQNLLCSFYLKPMFLQPFQMALLSKAVALAVADAVTELLNEQVMVKWPNDLICEDAKIGGILIENSLGNTKINDAVIGIGINVNQTPEGEGIKATSITDITGRHTPVNALLSSLCRKLEQYYLKLKKGSHAEISSAYNRLLYGKGQIITYKIGNLTAEGRLIGVNENGNAEIETAEGTVNLNYNQAKIYYHGFNY